MKGNALILAHTRAVPPVHRIEVKFSTFGQPPSQFVIADLPAAVVVREDRIADQSDNRMGVLSYGTLPPPARPAIQKPTDSGESTT